MIRQFVFLIAVVPASCQIQELQTSSAPQSEIQTSAENARVLDLTCPKYVETNPRGLSCLHCMHPYASEQRKIIAKIMYDSCLRNLSTNILVDGSFSYDPYAVADLVEPLTENGRQLFLTFYLSNGSSQRRWSTTKVNGFGTNLSPEVFRSSILNSEVLQSAYQDIVKRIVPVMQYAVSKGVKIQLVPALEDNLDKQSFEKLADLTLESLPYDLSVTIGRNPCPRCYRGNTTEAPYGYYFEVHTANAAQVISDGVVTNDGENLALDKLKAVRDEANAKSSQFVLWDRARQGLPDNLKEYPDVDQRTYKIPSDAERKEIIEFLQGR